MLLFETHIDKGYNGQFEFVSLSSRLRQVNRYYKGWRQYNTLVTKIVTKAILRGGFSLGADGPLRPIRESELAKDCAPLSGADVGPRSHIRIVLGRPKIICCPE